MLITWPGGGGGGGAYRNFDLSNIFFPPPPPPLYKNNDRSLNFKLAREIKNLFGEATPVGLRRCFPCIVHSLFIVSIVGLNRHEMLGHTTPFPNGKVQPANLMIKTFLGKSPQKNFLRCQLYARAYVRIWTLRPCIIKIKKTITNPIHCFCT